MSYHIYTTPGIVFRARSLREVDKVYTILTRDLGLIRATGGGVRKEESKLRASLEPYSISSISFVKGKEYWRITSSALEYSLAETRAGRKKLRSIARASQLLLKMVKGESKNSELFDRVEKVTKFVSKNEFSEKEEEAIEIFLVLGILYELGYISHEHIPKEFLKKEISNEILDSVLKNKKVLIKAINNGIQSSHLI